MKFLAYLLLFAALPVWAGTEDDIAAAYQAYRAGDRNKLATISPRLRNTPLRIYADYYQLSLDVDRADSESIKRFLSSDEDTPVIDRFRAEWLKHLGKTAQWNVFDSEYPKLKNEDVEIKCYSLQSRWYRNDSSALNDARSVWATGKSLPDSCGYIFDTAIDNGVIKTSDIWQRFRLALEAGNASLATRIAERLGGQHSVPIAALKSASADGVRYLKSVQNENGAWGEGKRAVVMFALLRVMKQSPDQAWAFWQDIRKQFPEAEQQYFAGWMGYETGRRHDPRAIDWYRAAANTPLNETLLAWKVRVALRAQDWQMVLNSINAMSEKQQKESAWQYWKARALLVKDNRSEANKILAVLGGEISFYGQLANEELGAPALKNTTVSFKPQPQEINAMRARPNVQRTILLYRADLRGEALKEWAWTVRNFTDQELLTAAEVARRHDMFDRAIGAADKTVSVHDFSLRYLAPYRSALQPHIRENALDEAWVYGLIRQESRFIPAAKSNVGASGLMQVMPTTARWLANQLGMKNFHPSMLQHVDTNLRLGTYYLRTVFDQLSNNPVLASAAYNAGPGRARRWRDDKPLEGAIYIESIPFEETRDYVKKVMVNTLYYAEQFNDNGSRSLKQRIGTIPAKPSSDNG